MKIQTPLSGRRLRRAMISSVGAVAFCAAASVFAQSSSSSSSTSSTPSYDTSGSSTNTRTGTDRTRTGSGGSTTGTSGSAPTGAYDSSTSGTSGSARSGSMANDSSTLARADRRFVTKAVELNTEEVRLSELAAQQATSPEVRAFAQQLVTDHTQAGTELSGIASRKGLAATTREDYDQRAVMKLGKKSGSDFDKAYLDKMVDAHDDAVDLFDKAAKDAKDPELQAFASKMLPKLREHQQHAKSLEQTTSTHHGTGMSGSSSTPSSSSTSDSSSGGMTR